MVQYLKIIKNTMIKIKQGGIIYIINNNLPQKRWNNLKLKKIYI